MLHYESKDHFVYVPSQWEMALNCNALRHFLGAYTKMIPADQMTIDKLDILLHLWEAYKSCRAFRSVDSVLQFKSDVIYLLN